MKKVFLALTILSSFAFNTKAQTFKTDFKEQRNTATFTTEAPLEDIVGTTRKIEAEVSINPANVAQNPKATVKVDLTSLNSGIDLRDEHMKSDKFLNTAKFPQAVFSLTGISGATTLSDGVKTKVTLTGNITLHGVTKPLTVPATLTYFKQSTNTASKGAGNLLKASANFNIQMTDFGIEVPSMLVMKVSNDVKIAIDFVASDAGACNPCGPCNPCGTKKDANGKATCAPKKGGKQTNPCNPCAPKK